MLEIGVEELPASFVEGAIRALPELAQKRFAELRLTHGAVHAYGTPRRLALVVQGLATRQPDLAEEVTGPPAKAAFKDGVPTKAAEAFAAKLGVSVADLRRVETPKGEYLVGTKREAGQSALSLLPAALTQIITAIPFRKSMRWGNGDLAFGRPIQWLVALLGEHLIELELSGIKSHRASRGHRFLHSGAVQISSAATYLDELRAAHVIADPEERARLMRERLEAAAKDAGGKLIEDDFLVGENLSLVEEPQVVVGGFETEYLELPERVILEVAKGHQRYFGARAPDGRLLPKYLSVVNTALAPENIRRGNDRAMRARLADARFFYRTDLETPLADRRQKLAGIVFQKRLGTVLGKAERIERLARELGLLLMLPEATVMAAASGAHLCKCDLVTLMVGEFPELQGEVGRTYAKVQGVAADVADVIHDHYLPKGAADATAPTDAGALVAMADRLDTLVGCFAIGLTPTGAADPYGLRRACLGVLRTMLDRGFDLRLGDIFRAAYDGYGNVKLDLSRDELVQKLGEFFAERLRGLLSDKLPSDAVNAALGAADRPLDARARATAIAELDAQTRADVGEVFKRATNIADKAPAGDPVAPPADAHESERALHTAFVKVQEQLRGLVAQGAYKQAFQEIRVLVPVLHKYFEDVLVMDKDPAVRDNRLRLMRSISDTCRTLARLELLGA
ncbi:Glycyl-tRNA synthetase beta chain [Minicystis rosea]|nr:Glycyl-tRNA synthetase beta chain [Minicystis rosea]